jgi:hypothetical protein
MCDSGDDFEDMTSPRGGQPASEPPKPRGKQPLETQQAIVRFAREGMSLCGIDRALQQARFKNSTGKEWPRKTDHKVVERVLAAHGIEAPETMHDSDAVAAGDAEGDEQEDTDDADDEIEQEEDEEDEDDDDAPRARRTGATPVYNEGKVFKRIMSQPPAASASSSTARGASTGRVARAMPPPPKRGGSGEQKSSKKAARTSAAPAAAGHTHTNQECEKIKVEHAGMMSSVTPSISYKLLCATIKASFGLGTSVLIFTCVCFPPHPPHLSFPPDSSRPLTLTRNFLCTMVSSPRSHRYTDSEGDLLRVATEAELRHAVASFKQSSSSSSLRLRLHPSDHAGSQAPATVEI